MRWSTHALVGAAAGSLLGSVSGHDTLTLMAIGGVFGVLPDIDLIASGVSRTAHRSPLTHSILGAAILAFFWALFCLCAEYFLGFATVASVSLFVGSATAFCSAFLHAAVDTASVSGCKALYPASHRKFRGPVRYDDWAVNVALSLVALGVIVVSASMDQRIALSY